MDQDRLELGRRLKKIRSSAGLSLHDLAGKADCSESAISKIENGKGNPSLNLLHRLASALNVSIGHLFIEENDNRFVLRKGQRPIMGNLSPSHGVSLEALMSRQSEHLLQAHIHIVEPGGKTDVDISHEGEEVGYVLEGELDLVVDGKSVHLNEGDSFFFQSEKAHRYANNGSKKARIIWVNTPPTF